MPHEFSGAPRPPPTLRSVNVVFGGGLWPLGWHVGYVEADWSDAVEEFASWMKRIRRRVGIRKLDSPILEQLETLAPLEAPWTRELLVETTSGWTAHFSNFTLGGDSWPRVSYLGKQLGVRWVMATHIPIGQYSLPATQLWLGGPSGDGLGFVRTITAGIFDDGHWEFAARGEVQPWEETDAYLASRVRDRLTRELLLRYLHALGIEADDPSFYGSGLRVQDRSLWRWWRRPLRKSIARARADYTSSSPRP